MKKILIIEDDSIVAHIYRSRLEKEGYTVEVCEKVVGQEVVSPDLHFLLRNAQTPQFPHQKHMYINHTACCFQLLNPNGIFQFVTRH